MNNKTNLVNIRPKQQGEMAFILEVFTEAWTKKAPKKVVNILANKYGLKTSEVEAFELECEKDFVKVYNKFNLEAVV